MMHARMQRDKTLRGGTSWEAVTHNWFKNTNLTVDQIENIFDSVSFNLEGLPDGKKSIGFADSSSLGISRTSNTRASYIASITSTRSPSWKAE